MIIEILKKNLVIDPDMYWIALFHDTGKGATYHRKEDGTISYLGHEIISTDIFMKYAHQLKFTTKQIEKICFIIKNHLLFGRILDMKKIKARKLFLHKYFEDFYTFCNADYQGRIPSKTEYSENVKKVYEDFLSVYDAKLLATGNDIMERYPNLKGRDIGKKLNEMNNEIIGNM